MQPRIHAGEFSSWLRGMRSVLGSDEESDVPCGECMVCCMSCYFVYIRPDEIEALAAIPKQWLFPAPGMPRGIALLMYDKKGKCPMLSGNGCSIHASRPRVCRKYDCRIFPATGISAGNSRPLVCQRTDRWQFGYPTGGDQTEHAAVRNSARFLRESSASLPSGFVPAAAIDQATLALKTYRALLPSPDGSDKQKMAPSVFDTAKAIVAEHTEFCLGNSA